MAFAFILFILKILTILILTEKGWAREAAHR